MASEKSLQFRLALVLPALVTIIPIGAYSDYLGRRFLFLIAIVGFFFQDGVAAVVVLLDLDLNWLFLGVLLSGCCGGPFTTDLAVYAYTADNTPASGVRTLSIALAGAGSALSTIAGLLGGGYFIQDVGFFYPLLTSNLLLLLAIVLTAAFLEETNPLRASGGSIREWPPLLVAMKSVFGFYFSRSASAEPAARNGRSHDSLSSEEVDIVHRTDTRDRRLEYSLGIAVFFFSVLPSIGLENINMLYEMNEPFCWDSKTIGVFNTLRAILQHFLSIGALRTLSWRMREEWIGAMGFVSMGGGFLVMAFATHDWMLYVGTFFHTHKSARAPTHAYTPASMYANARTARWPKQVRLQRLVS